jgi:hypothetical protein
MTWKRVMRGVVVVMLFGGPVFGSDVPDKPADVIGWVAEAWTEEGWDASLKAGYMRVSDDSGWHQRMIGMQALVRSGPESVGPLVEALVSGDAGMRVFAAQTLSYLAPFVKQAGLLAALQDEETAVRLYAVDALGMSGADSLAELLGPMKTADENRDVKKHIDYALLRSGSPVDEKVAGALLSWDPMTIDSAMIGEMAPDFTLMALTGESIRLSDFRGKKAVVIVFIYGDT